MWIFPSRILGQPPEQVGNRISPSTETGTPFAAEARQIPGDEVKIMLAAHNVTNTRQGMGNCEAVARKVQFLIQIACSASSSCLLQRKPCPDFIFAELYRPSPTALCQDDSNCSNCISFSEESSFVLWFGSVPHRSTQNAQAIF